MRSARRGPALGEQDNQGWSSQNMAASGDISLIFKNHVHVGACRVGSWVYLGHAWPCNILGPKTACFHPCEAMSAESVDSAKPRVDLENLALEWEKQEAIRNHLRGLDGEGNKNILFATNASESVVAACVPHVHALMSEILNRIAQEETRPQPQVDELRDEISSLYKRCSVVVDEAQVIHDSWMVRKFCTFLKMKVRLEKVSTVTHLESNHMRNVLCNVEILYTCLKIVFYVVTAIPPEWYFSCCKKPRWRSFKNFAWFSTQCFRKNLCLPILFKKKRTYFWPLCHRSMCRT